MLFLCHSPFSFGFFSFFSVLGAASTRGRISAGVPEEQQNIHTFSNQLLTSSAESRGHLRTCANDGPVVHEDDQVSSAHKLCAVGAEDPGLPSEKLHDAFLHEMFGHVGVDRRQRVIQQVDVFVLWTNTTGEPRPTRLRGQRSNHSVSKLPTTPHKFNVVLIRKNKSFGRANRTESLTECVSEPMNHWFIVSRSN